jgi:hypothetical protein
MKEMFVRFRVSLFAVVYYDLLFFCATSKPRENETWEASTSTLLARSLVNSRNSEFWAYVTTCVQLYKV